MVVSIPVIKECTANLIGLQANCSCNLFVSYTDLGSCNFANSSDSARNFTIAIKGHCVAAQSFVDPVKVLFQADSFALLQARRDYLLLELHLL